MDASSPLMGTPQTMPAAGTAGREYEDQAMLQRVLNAHKVGGSIIYHCDLPQYRVYRVALNFAASPAKILTLEGAFALAVGADSCRVSRLQGKLWLEIPKQAEERGTLSAGKFDRDMPTDRMKVPLGVTAIGAPFWLDLEDERNAQVLIAGITGAGKSMAVRWILYRLLTGNPPQRLQVVGFDPKRQDLKPFEQSKHLRFPIANNIIEAQRIMAWLIQEMDRRAQNGTRTPRIVVVAEEMPELIDESPEIKGYIKRLVQMGRALGIQLIGTAQQPSIEELGKGFAQFPTRIVGRIASGSLAYTAAGRAGSGVEWLLGRGDMVVVSAGEMTRVQMPDLREQNIWGNLQTMDRKLPVDELPAIAAIADLQRDARGGRGRKELDEFDYRSIDERLEQGATAETIKVEFGIGWERSKRLFDNYWEAKR